MTNATKTLALIFASTLALALATSWSWSTASSAAFQEQLLAVDTSAVQAVRIERPSRPSIRLAQTDNGWRVSPGDTSATYPAGTRAVDRLLGTVPALEVSAVATRQPDKHPRYGVDSTGTTVTMLGGRGRGPRNAHCRAHSRPALSVRQRGPVSEPTSATAASGHIRHVRPPPRPAGCLLRRAVAPLGDGPDRGGLARQDHLGPCPLGHPADRPPVPC
jgi:hypothetical protein